jgi:serine/threonine protein phosphatase PrpC
MNIDAAGVSHIGRVRHGNEDAFLVDAAGGVFLVCDGMGGMQAGDEASAMAVDTVAGALREARLLARPPGSPTGESPTKVIWAELMRRAVAEANERIFDEGRRRGIRMGATLVALAATESGLICASVGDSRIYRVRDGAAEQLSDDHSLAMAKVRQGVSTMEQAAIDPDRHVLYRALGMEPEVDPDIFDVPALPHDCLILCSDGLHGFISDADIAREALRPGQSAQAVCDALLALTLKTEARDNVTVVALRLIP